MLEQRKADHIRINLEEDISFNMTTGFEKYRFEHQALPELDLKRVNLETTFFGKKLRAPLLVSSMTGGTTQAVDINRRLATAAEARGIALGVGSQRAAIENLAVAKSFEIRSFAPHILLFANLGAVQLNYGYGLVHCQRAVDMIQADALILHFNPLQEAVQPEGDTNFSDLYNKVEAICKALPVPVIAKEVGWGFSVKTAQRLASCGISAIDVAGAGGTSWSQVEMYRASTAMRRQIAAAFLDWGIPTADAILAAQEGAPALPIIASGGLHTGVDVAKSIALGANLAGLAGGFLHAAVESTDAVLEMIDVLTMTTKIAMFAAGIKDISTLYKSEKLRRISA